MLAGKLKRVLTVSGSSELTVQHLEAGIYIVEVVTDKGMTMKKLLVE